MAAAGSGAASGGGHRLGVSSLLRLRGSGDSDYGSEGEVESSGSPNGDCHAQGANAAEVPEAAHTPPPGGGGDAFDDEPSDSADSEHELLGDLARSSQKAEAIRWSMRLRATSGSPRYAEDFLHQLGNPPRPPMPPEPMRSTATAPTTIPGATAPTSDAPPALPLEQRSIAELKRLITERGLDMTGLVEKHELVARLRAPLKHKRSEAGVAQQRTAKKARRQRKRQCTAADPLPEPPGSEAEAQMRRENARLGEQLERERKRCRREKKAAIDRGKQLGRNEITASRRAKKTAKALRNTAGAARRDRTCQRKAQGSGTGPSAQRAGRKATRAAQQQDQPPPPPPQHRRYSRQQGQQQWRVPQHQQGNQQHPSQQQWRAQPPPPPRQPSHHTPPWPRRA